MKTDVLTPREIKLINDQALLRLSSLQGDETESMEGDEFEGDEFEGDNYVGFEDDHLDFSGSGKSFLNEGRSSITYSFKLQNATAAKKIVALVPTYLGTAAAIATATGETVDGILTDGAIITNLTGTAGNSKLTIAGLQAFVGRNPTRIMEITIVSNDTSTFEDNITYQHLSPFRSLQNNRIPLTDYIKPEQFNTKKACIAIGKDYPELQLNDQTIILLPIGGTDSVATTGIILNITLRLGAVLSNAGALNKKSNRAANTMSRIQHMPSATANRFLKKRRK